jgi:hypothetical protein
MDMHHFSNRTKKKHKIYTFSDKAYYKKYVYFREKKGERGRNMEDGENSVRYCSDSEVMHYLSGCTKPQVFVH